MRQRILAALQDEKAQGNAILLGDIAELFKKGLGKSDGAGEIRAPQLFFNLKQG